MNAVARARPRALVVWFRDLHRWLVGSFVETRWELARLRYSPFVSHVKSYSCYPGRVVVIRRACPEQRRGAERALDLWNLVLGVTTPRTL
jgi:hypothetical protein